MLHPAMFQQYHRAREFERYREQGLLGGISVGEYYVFLSMYMTLCLSSIIKRMGMLSN